MDFVGSSKKTCVLNAVTQNLIISGESIGLIQSRTSMTSELINGVLMTASSDYNKHCPLLRLT